MKRATITISEELDQALVEYGRDQDLPENGDALVEAALRSLLAGHGYLAPVRSFLITSLEHGGDEADPFDEFPYRPFFITPLHRDDGPTDISENHDRYFADGETSGSR